MSKPCRYIYGSEDIPFHFCRDKLTPEPVQGFFVIIPSMPINKAKNYYLGKGSTRLNCAQSVIKAFQEHFGYDDKLVAEFLACGGGRAPGGVCGAYFAAKHLLQKKDPAKLTEFDNWFLEKAGSLQCREIREKRQLSCLGCVEKAAEFIARQ